MEHSALDRLQVIKTQFLSDQKAPVNVTITGAAGNIGYALVMMAGQGRMFGPNQSINLTLLEVPPAANALKGVLMELQDCALPLINKLTGSTDQKEAFKGCHYAILVGARPRGPGMERKDLLSANAKIFQEQGRAINEFANENCKVLVVGNPANTNALICALNAPKIPRQNFTALTRLDHNRALFQIANKLNTPISKVNDVVIWGNHSLTQYPDLRYSTIVCESCNTRTVKDLVDEQWVKKEFIPTVQKRGAAIIEMRKLSSAASAANAVCDHMYDWVHGLRSGNKFTSMAVMSDGSYGVPKDIIFSFPVVCKNGEWKIYPGLQFDEFSKQMIEKTTKELLEEKEMALNALKN